MRNYQKQQLLEIMESLHLLHQEMKERLGRKEYLTVQTAFSDCQEAAIQVGEAIEQMEGEGTEAVTHLEQYCEKVYHLSLQIESIQAQKLYKTLESALIKAENAIVHRTVRKEVVFLPYKASMWDSLESVYLAAREDENCDVYCVPIPYYDKRPDGSFGEFHYEGSEYPKNIEITDYRAYNLKEKHPDVIYIHNPYDEWNNVTCVPENYFCRNLCHYTDCLVYIPYFILGEFKQDSQKDIDGIKHFCFLPGTIYAHKVIVQSENMRQIYINEYSKAAKPLGLPADRKMLEGKILGLGSPKLDKVQNTKKENLEIPEEWQRVIKRSDGIRKKIVFYNTSINALLYHNEKMLEKIKYVFRIFKERQDEVTLLWRPHPLIPNTIKSMRPQLWKEYEKIVNEYKWAGWGIYDDSADMDRAVMMSDAYYGDRSSVVQVYQSTHKPIMLQSINCADFDWNALFGTYKIIEYKGNVWFFATLFNGLFLLNLRNGELEWKGKIPNEKDGVDNLFRDYIIADGKVFFAPTKAENIAIYHIDEEKYEILPLDVKKYWRSANYASIVQNGEELYFIGVCGTNAICKFSMNTGGVSYIGIEAIAEIEQKSSEALYGVRRCIRKNILYIPLLQSGYALKVDLQTEKAELLYLTEQQDMSFSMAIYIPNKDVIWFVSQSGYIIQWDEERQEKKIIQFSDCSDQTVEEYFTYKLKEDRLYLFPVKREMESKCIDIYTYKCIETFQMAMLVLDIKEIDGTEYYLVCKSDAKFYIDCINEDGVKEEKVIHRKDNRSGRECLREYQINFFRESAPIYYESSLAYQYGRSLDAYIEWVIADAEFNIDNAGMNDDKNINAGNRIWDYIRRI